MIAGERYYLPGGKNTDGLIETPFVISKAHFLIRCSECHTGLCKRLSVLKTPKRQQNLILVEPCPRCLAAAQAGVPVTVIRLDDFDREVDDPE